MARNKYRAELIRDFGSFQAVATAVRNYLATYRLTPEQVKSGEWIYITKLVEACEKAGISYHGPNSILVRSAGGDRALYQPWHESFRSYYWHGDRWFHKSALTEGIAAIQAILKQNDPIDMWHKRLLYDGRKRLQA